MKSTLVSQRSQDSLPALNEDDHADARSAWAWWPAVAAVVLAFAWPGRRSILLDYGVEIVIITLIVRLVTRRPAIKDAISAANPVAKFGAKLFVGVVLLTQILGVSTGAWPLTDWKMYTVTPPQNVSTYQVHGETAEGAPVEFLPSFSNHTLSTKMPYLFLRQKAALVHELRNENASSAELDGAAQDLEDALLTFLELHNEHKPTEAVTTITVTRLDFTLEEARADDITRSEVLRVEVTNP